VLKKQPATSNKLFIQLHWYRPIQLYIKLMLVCTVTIVNDGSILSIGVLV